LSNTEVNLPAPDGITAVSGLIGAIIEFHGKSRDKGIMVRKLPMKKCLKILIRSYFDGSTDFLNIET
jgi:hypothetical protein